MSLKSVKLGRIVLLSPPSQMYGTFKFTQGIFNHRFVASVTVSLDVSSAPGRLFLTGFTRTFVSCLFEQWKDRLVFALFLSVFQLEHGTIPWKLCYFSRRTVCWWTSAFKFADWAFSWFPMSEFSRLKIAPFFMGVPCVSSWNLPCCHHLLWFAYDSCGTLLDNPKNGAIKTDLTV